MDLRAFRNALCASAAFICATTLTPAAAYAANPPTGSAEPQATEAAPQGQPDAQAQATALQAAPLDPSPSQANVGAGAQGDASPADVVVTGSRVITNGNNSPSPVTIVATEQLQQVTPSNIPDGLNRLPVFSGSSNQSNLGAAERNFSGNYLNLRNVGAGRSLILFDGHRFPPTTTDNLVDTNTIPQLLLQRVDVVTGGASAVYGSDAITGVVNFVVDRNFNGVKVNVQGGQSYRQDNASYRVGIAAGLPLFDGRGHFEASVEHYDSEGIDSKLTREYGRRVYSTQGAGTAANPYRVVTNTRLTNFSRFGIIKTGVFADQVFGGPGDTLRPFVHGSTTGSSGVESGGDGTFYDSTLQASLRSSQAFARFDFDVSDSIHFYAQGTATKSFNQFSKEENVINNLTFSADNAFLLPAVSRRDARGHPHPADLPLCQADDGSAAADPDRVDQELFRDRRAGGQAGPVQLGRRLFA